MQDVEAYSLTIDVTLNVSLRVKKEVSIRFQIHDLLQVWFSTLK